MASIQKSHTLDYGRVMTRPRRLAVLCGAVALLSAGIVAPLAASAAPVGSVHATVHRVAPHLPASALTFVVNTTADTHDANLGDGKCRDSGGRCSLRAAIEEANALHRAVNVMLSGVTYTTAGLGALVVADAHGINIVGAGAATKIVATSGTDRVILDSGLLQLANLTVSGGVAPTGGFMQGDGGGIEVNGGTSSLVMNGVTLTNNQARQGGGIYSEGALWITNSTISHNTVSAAYQSAYGGGIYTKGTLDLTNSLITYNKANDGPNVGRGGGIYVDGATAIVGGSFTHNSVTSTTQSASGGGIYVSEATTINGTTFSNNFAGPGAGSTNVSAYGGGITGCYGLGELVNVNVTNNTVQAAGTGSAYGGGFQSDCGATRVIGSTFKSNQAVTPGSGDANGGGIDISSKGSGFLDITTTLIKSNLAQNSGTGTGNGGGIALVGDNSGGSMRLTHSTILSNRAVNPAGSTGEQIGGGGIFDWSCGAGSLIDFTTVQGNVAVNSQGGGLYDSSCGDILNGDKFIGNQATGSTVAGSTYQTEGAGGGLSLYDTAVVTNTLVASNTASQIGGGIYSDDNQILRGDVISGNHANQGAGYFADWGALITSTAVINNVGTGVGNAGGGLYISSNINTSSVTLDGSTVTGNVATHGAGIGTESSGSVLHATILAGNTTPAKAEAECALVAGGTMGSAGGNRVGDASCLIHAPGDRQGKADAGYTIAGATGKIYAFNTSAYGHLPSTAGTVVALTSTPDGQGYWIATTKGLFAFGDATYYGGSASHIAAVAAAPDGRGYWVVSSTGVVHGYGSATSFGSAPGHAIAGIAVTPDGQGYWLAAKNGAVFHFGTAKALGSKPGQSIAGIAGAPDGLGYWLVTRTGTVFGFGSAKSHGSATGQSVVAIAAAPDGQGYWLLGTHGAIYNFGSAVSKGSLVTRHQSAAVTAFAAF